MLNFFSAEIMISFKMNLKITIKIEILKSETLPHYLYNVGLFELAEKNLQLPRVLPKRILKKKRTKNLIGTIYQGTKKTGK